MISEHLDKNNLHHAYLIEGTKEDILPELFEFMKSLGIKTSGNADFCQIFVDSFKIENAHDLKSFSTEKSVSAGKKIFLISANNFLLEAQNSLLKMFEEPIENTHFFLIMPDTNVLLKTLISRFYVISPKPGLGEETKEVEKFLKLSLRDRVDFIKELLKETENEEDEIISSTSSRSKALKFLNALEYVLHHTIFNKSKAQENSAVFTLPGVPGGSYAAQNFFAPCFEQILKVRKFLRMPGSSTKSLMESVALIVPNF